MPRAARDNSRVTREEGRGVAKLVASFRLLVPVGAADMGLD